MRISSLKLGLLAGAILPLAITGAVIAAEAPPPDAGPPSAHGDHPWRDPAQRQAMMAEHLRDALQLTPGQEPALNQFLAAMHPSHDHDRMDRDGGPPSDQAQMTTPERLDRMLAHFDEMRTKMVARVEATKTFYAQLSPSQQKAFDALPMMGMGGRHGEGMGGMGGHHHHGDGDEHEMGPDGPPHG